MFAAKPLLLGLFALFSLLISISSVASAAPDHSQLPPLTLTHAGEYPLGQYSLVVFDSEDESETSDVRENDAQGRGTERKITDQKNINRNKHGQSNLNWLLQQIANGNGQLHQQPQLNFGFSQPSIWLVQSLQLANADHSWYSWLHYALIDRMTVFMCPRQQALQRIDELDTQQCQTIHGGDHQPFYPRAIDHPHLILKLPHQSPDDYWLISHIQTQGTYQLPIALIDQHNLQQSLLKHNLFRGGFILVLLVMGLYNLSLFATSRQYDHLYYAAFVLSFLVFHISYEGSGFQFLWPQTPWFNNWAVPLAYAINLMCLAAFVRHFLQLKQRNPKIEQLYQLFIVLGFLSAAALPWLPYKLIIAGQNLLSLALAFTSLSAGILAWRQGLSAARFFTIAWLVFIGGLSLANARTLGWLNPNLLTLYGYQLGSLLEIVLLSLSLGERLRTLQLQQLQQRKALLVQQQQQNQALQQLIRGLCHEMNTPLGNIRTLQTFVSEECKPQRGNEALHSGLEGIAANSERLVQLLSDMRQAAAVDVRHQPQWLDLPAWLEQWQHSNKVQTLLQRDNDKDNDDNPAQLQVEFKAQPALPRVWLCPQALEQILTELLSNALLHNPPAQPPKTYNSTTHNPDHPALQIHLAVELKQKKSSHYLQLHFSDNGIGIDDDQHSRVLQPFVTRLHHRQHTGLGLFRVQTLVRDVLKGELSFHSSDLPHTASIPSLLSGLNLHIRLPVRVADLASAGSLSANALHASHKTRHHTQNSPQDPEQSNPLATL